jgi:hypothetical protein
MYGIFSGLEAGFCFVWIPLVIWGLCILNGIHVRNRGFQD